MSKEAFARYYDSLGGTMCLAVAQNLVDLLWAVGGWDDSGRLQVKPFACPRQNAPNCALHAALIMRALYLNFPIADVTAASVGLFRRQLGELLQRSRGTYQSSNMPPCAVPHLEYVVQWH